MQTQLLSVSWPFPPVCEVSSQVFIVALNLLELVMRENFTRVMNKEFAGLGDSLAVGMGFDGGERSDLWL